MRFFSFSAFFFAVFLLSFPSLSSPAQALNLRSDLNPSLPIWTCKLEKKESPWTVGEKRRMNCKGDYTDKFEDSPKVVFPKEKAQNKQTLGQEKNESEAKAKAKAKQLYPDPSKFQKQDLEHSLVVLNLETSDHDRASFVVTSYKAGPFYSPFFLQNSRGLVFVKSIFWEVASVLQKDKPPQAFGPMGPIFLSWPKKYKFILLGFMTLLLFFILFEVFQFFLRKIGKAKMLKKRTSLSPYLQLNKDLRTRIRFYDLGKAKQKSEEEKQKWNREYMQGLKIDFCLFIEREFLIPVQLRKRNSFIKEIQKFRLFKGEKKAEAQDLFRRLSVIMREFQGAIEGQNPIKDLDCEQMTEWIRKWSGNWQNIKKWDETLKPEKNEYKRKRA